MKRLIFGGAVFALLALALSGVALYRFSADAKLSAETGLIVRQPGYVAQIRKGHLGIKDEPIQRAGSRLIFSARVGTDAWPLELPLDWNADPFHNVNWQFQLHALRMIDPLLSSFFNTGNEEHLREAFTYVRDWFRYHYEEHKSSRMEWYDMAAGIRAMKLALFLDRYQAGQLDLSPEDARILAVVVDEHAGRLQNESYIAKNNHGLLQVFGLNLLCAAAKDRTSCANGRAFAGTMFARLLHDQFTEEGVHRENSPAYHEFVRRTIASLNSEPTAKIPGADTQELLRRVARIKPWLIDPQGNFVAIGDSSGRGKPLALKAASEVAVGDFTKSGYGIVRDKNSMLFMMGMAHKFTHKHADDLSFVLFEHGRPLFIDSGKYGYNDNPMRRYVMSAAAHNTVSLLDRDIKPKDVVLVGSELNPIEREGDLFKLSGKVERPGLFTQHREIQYRPDRQLIVRDEISSDREWQFVSSLHLARDLTPQLVEGGFDVPLQDEKIVKARLSETDCRIEMVRGQEKPILGWESVAYLKMEPASVVRAICPGRNRSITWTIALQ